MLKELSAFVFLRLFASLLDVLSKSALEVATFVDVRGLSQRRVAGVSASCVSCVQREPAEYFGQSELLVNEATVLGMTQRMEMRKVVLTLLLYPHTFCVRESV